MDDFCVFVFTRLTRLGMYCQCLGKKREAFNDHPFERPIIIVFVLSLYRVFFYQSALYDILFLCAINAAAAWVMMKKRQRQRARPHTPELLKEQTNFHLVTFKHTKRTDNLKIQFERTTSEFEHFSCARASASTR